MPTYQYACTDCGHAFDIVQSFSDDSLTVCPECDGRLRKVFNAVGVVFKGSGFYRTDSRGKQTSDASGSSKDSSTTSTGTGSGNGSSGSGSSDSGSSGNGSSSPKSDSTPSTSGGKKAESTKA